MSACLSQPSLAANPERRTLMMLFSLGIGLFAVIHAVTCAVRYRVEMYPSTWMIFVLGALLLRFPRQFWLLVGLLVVMSVDAWLQAPASSNHTILKNFFLLGFLVVSAHVLIARGNRDAWFSALAGIGRLLLLVMYVFGVFHKINTDFIDPGVSCAVSLWRVMPWPLNALDATPLHYAGIYGTFIIESAIFVCLLIPRARHLGVVVGIGFHLFLGLSGYAMYIAFSTLTAALHLLFVTPDGARRIFEAEAVRWAGHWFKTFPGLLVFALCLWVIAVSGQLGNYSSAALVWLGFVVPAWWIVSTYGAPCRESEAIQLFPRPLWLNIVPVLFFINCATPYVGLKTAQSMNMFSNLHLEGGRSNHLVMRSAPGPFGYLEDVVRITDAGGIPRFRFVESRDLRVVYYDLLDQLERHPDARVGFERGGILYSNIGAHDMRDEIDRVLHPRWARKWFHFLIVDPLQPQPCTYERSG